MKKHVVGFLAILMLFSMMSTLAVQAEETQGNPNLVSNGGFEELNEKGMPTGWEFSNEQYVSVDTKNKSDGENALKVSTSTGGNPWIRTTIMDPVPGGTYEVSVMTNAELAAGSPTEGIVIKMEIYNAYEMTETTYMGTLASEERWPDSTNNVWVRRSSLFTMPESTKMAVVYFRFSCNGTVRYDDIEVKYAGDPQKYTFVIGDVFHYPYEEKGTATVSLASFFVGKPVETEARVDFELRDGDKVLDAQKDTPFTNLEAVYTYDISLLKEKKKAYTVYATAKWGDEEETFKQNVYVFDRPSMIGDDGRIYIDGEVFNPVIATAVLDTTFDKLVGSGVNVVVWSGYGRNEQELAACDRYLDMLDKLGMKCLFVLYHKMLPAGHPDNLESTIKTVERFKDDPRIFAWYVMDEPFLYNEHPEMSDWMETSYRVIREIDDMHPVQIVDMVTLLPPKYADMFTNDAYAKEDNRSVTIKLSSALEQNDSDFYFQSLIDVYKANGVMQTEKGMRGSAYRSFEAGVKGIGYYAIKNAIGHDPGDPVIPLYEHELWEPFCNFNNNELPILFDIFVNGKYQQFNAYQDESNPVEGDYWSTWTDGKVVYMIVHNKSTAKKTIEVPLTSANGLVSIGSRYKIEQIAGPEVTPTGKDSLSFELDDQSVVLFKLTPMNTIKLDKLKESAFSDLAGYTWAEKEINALYAKNIVNAVGDKLYGPGQNITRADFAMFLIRTLGLTSDSTELFADVPADAYYAKELATGKALGILKGVDAANYNPNAEISRQDMMTICYRGLTHVGKNKTSDNAILEKFLDKASIADYATEAVRDMAGMEIVKGDPSGNVNPLGNTTRAEAAVIMNRILGL